MSFKTRRSIMLLGALAKISMLAPIASPASAQQWQDRGRDWQRDAGQRGDWNRRDRERHRRNDAKSDGVVAGVVGTAVLVGVIAAIADSNKKRDRDRDGYRDRDRDRADYCRDRYGNYDPQFDGYRASDGRIYRCE